jgi:hypothetical protein
VSPKTDWYEAQAKKAKWSGTVDGKPAYVDCFKGQWEVACRVSSGKEGVVMFQLRNKDAIRNLAAAAAPPIPEKVLKQALRKARLDEPVGGRKHRILGFVLLVVLVAAGVFVAMTFRK